MWSGFTVLLSTVRCSLPSPPHFYLSLSSPPCALRYIHRVPLKHAISSRYIFYDSLYQINTFDTFKSFGGLARNTKLKILIFFPHFDSVEKVPSVIWFVYLCITPRVYFISPKFNELNFSHLYRIYFGWNRFAQFYTTSVSQLGYQQHGFFVCRFKYSTKRSGNDSNQNENVGNVNEISQAHSVATSTITTIIDFFCAICYHSKFQCMHENRERKKTTKLNKAKQFVSISNARTHFTRTIHFVHHDFFPSNKFKLPLIKKRDKMKSFGGCS